MLSAFQYFQYSAFKQRTVNLNKKNTHSYFPLSTLLFYIFVVLFCIPVVFLFFFSFAFLFSQCFGEYIHVLHDLIMLVLLGEVTLLTILKFTFSILRSQYFSSLRLPLYSVSLLLQINGNIHTRICYISSCISQVDHQYCIKKIIYVYFEIKQIDILTNDFLFGLYHDILHI